MSTEKDTLQGLFREMRNFVEMNQAWELQLPAVKSADFQHHRFGSVRFSLSLEKRYHHGFQRDALILSLKITLGGGTQTRRLSSGEASTIMKAIRKFDENIETLNLKFPGAYQGFDYPRRLEL